MNYVYRVYIGGEQLREIWIFRVIMIGLLILTNAWLIGVHLQIYRDPPGSHTSNKNVLATYHGEIPFAKLLENLSRIKFHLHFDGGDTLISDQCQKFKE